MKTYDIPPEENIYIIQLVSQSNSSTSATDPIQYEVYNKDMVKLNLDLCANSNITITQPITNINSLNLELAKELAAKGIDIYDSESPIFNVQCTTFSLDGREKKIFIKMFLFVIPVAVQRI